MWMLELLDDLTVLGGVSFLPLYSGNTHSYSSYCLWSLAAGAYDMFVTALIYINYLGGCSNWYWVVECILE